MRVNGTKDVRSNEAIVSETSASKLLPQQRNRVKVAAGFGDGTNDYIFAYELCHPDCWSIASPLTPGPGWDRHLACRFRAGGPAKRETAAPFLSHDCCLLSARWRVIIQKFFDTHVVPDSQARQAEIVPHRIIPFERAEGCGNFTSGPEISLLA